jgi:hypothetical protein
MLFPGMEINLGTVLSYGIAITDEGNLIQRRQLWKLRTWLM